MRLLVRTAPVLAKTSAFACAVAWLLGACSAPAESVGADSSPDTGGDGYCRTRTCPAPSNYPTDDGQCQPPNWAESSNCRDNKLSDAPLWWRTSCVGYDLNQSASAQVAYADFAKAVDGAFAAWTGATCPSSGDGASQASIAVSDMGPIACAQKSWNASGPNQSVIVFHDDAWPYEASDQKAAHSTISLTVALTTTTYDTVTGELLDADMELNSADHTFVTPPPDSVAPADDFDLQSVITHEAGHFLGLAHSPRSDAVMWRSGDGDNSTAKRGLTAEDVRAICSVYPPGERNVSSLVAANGQVDAGACDPTPHGGFSSTCN